MTHGAETGFGFGLRGRSETVLASIRFRLRRIDPPRDHSYGKLLSSFHPLLFRRSRGSSSLSSRPSVVYEPAREDAFPSSPATSAPSSDEKGEKQGRLVVLEDSAFGQRVAWSVCTRRFAAKSMEFLRADSNRGKRDGRRRGWKESRRVVGRPSREYRRKPKSGLSTGGRAYYAYPSDRANERANERASEERGEAVG